MRIRDILTFDNYIFVYDQINDDMLSNFFPPIYIYIYIYIHIYIYIYGKHG